MLKSFASQNIVGISFKYSFDTYNKSKHSAMKVKVRVMSQMKKPRNRCRALKYSLLSNPSSQQSPISGSAHSLEAYTSLSTGLKHQLSH